jgi:hypothetical protein
LLQPFEYTKIDRIIDVIFTTAADVEEQVVEPVPGLDADKTHEAARQERTDPDLLNGKRLEGVEAFARLKGNEIVRHSRTLFWSSLPWSKNDREAIVPRKKLIERSN